MIKPTARGQRGRLDDRSFEAVFVGGPADGERLTVSKTHWEVIEQPQDPPRWSPDGIPKPAPDYKKHLYRAVTLVKMSEEYDAGLMVMASEELSDQQALYRIVSSYRGHIRWCRPSVEAR